MRVGTGSDFFAARVCAVPCVALSLANQRLDKNNLKNLPTVIADLPALLSLRFRENAIMTLQECFTKLTTLQVTLMARLALCAECILALCATAL